MKCNNRHTTLENLDSLCFGGVNVSEPLAAFRDAMNAEMMAYFRSLPESTHASTVVFFMQHFNAPLFPRCNYFLNYFVPSWSILYWIDQVSAESGLITPEDRQYALAAHAMALLLHPLDDHLNDRQLPATHLHLLLRSQAWLRMMTALEQLSLGVSGGGEIVREYLGDYYASIGAPPVSATLDGYCDHFRNQMATWMCAPALLALKQNFDEASLDTLLSAYGGFGIAWRLLDDLQDTQTDLANGCRSAIYFSLKASFRERWDATPGHPDTTHRMKILRAIRDGHVVEQVKNRIFQELNSAVSALEMIDMGAMAEEMRCMALPFRTEGTP